MTARDYFLHYPDKTQTILQVYFLNRVSKLQEEILFWIVDKLRAVCLWIGSE